MMVMFTNSVLTEKLVVASKEAIKLVESGGNLEDFDGVVDCRLLESLDDILYRQDRFYIIPIRENWEKKKLQTLHILKHTYQLLEFALFTGDISWKQYKQFNEEMITTVPNSTRDDVIQLCIKWLLRADYYDDI